VALAAHAVGHSSSCGFLLSPSPNSDIFSHEKFFNAFGFILTEHLEKNLDGKKM
jgi:hypothetical protein